MIRFEKWEGLGNDFIVVDRAQLPGEPSAGAVARVCDRHTGVGADGVLLVDRSRALPVMVVRNADGSRPEMCGNGLRCVAGFLANGNAETSATILTDAGELTCKLVSPSPDAVRVEASMGVGRSTGRIVVPVDGREHAFETINVGNPHAITFEAYESASMDRVGPAVEQFVAGGTNVEFVRDVEGRRFVRVWERGVGYTQACGTGAVAVAVAACLAGRAKYDLWQEIVLPGGPLEVFVETGTLRVRMRGPARRVYSGELPDSALD